MDFTQPFIVVRPSSVAKLGIPKSEPQEGGRGEKMHQRKTNSVQWPFVMSEEG